MKKRKVLAVLLCAAMTAALAVGCGGSKGSDSSDKSSDSSSSSDDVITVGFSQVGAESDWRTANSQSMKDTFSKENGYDLIFDDAQQKQENQITAIRNFIQQEVDYILLAPVTETGWDTVLQEAKDADIPVIIVDRMVDVSDDSLYTTWIGTDALCEGRKAAEWLNGFAEAKGIAASDGVAVAKAYLLVQPDLSFETVTVEDTSAEEARLDAALAASQDELSVIREKAVESLGEEAAAVFDAHLMVLADPEMTGQIKETIRAKQVNAEAALTEVTDMFIAIFEGMEDNPYMQERAADIRDVTKRVLANLLGKKLPNPATINEESIVVAHDLTQSWLVHLKSQPFLVQITSQNLSKMATFWRFQVLLVKLLSTQLKSKLLSLKQLVKLTLNKKLNGLSLKMLKQLLLMENISNWLLTSVHLKTLKV